MMKLKETENQIQSAICEYLTLMRFFFWRQNTTPIFDTRDGGFRRMPKYSKKGIPDIFVIVKGQMICFEVKSVIGIQSPEQKEFQQACELNDIQYHVVRSIDEVEKVLKNHSTRWG